MQLSLACYLIICYQINAQELKFIIGAVFCAVFGSIDFGAVVFGYCRKDPIPLFILYIMQYFAVITNTAIGIAFFTNSLPVALTFLFIVAAFYLGFSAALHR